MRLETRSKRLLAITKSKAKMYEFAIEESAHISLTQDPKKLLITTIGILGDLAALEARNEETEASEFENLKSELIAVGQYFDALIQTHLVDENVIYLKILGAAAYYLADMPGSASVLSKGLSYDSELLTSTFIEGLLIWLLKSDYAENWYRVENSYLTDSIDNVGETFRAYFELVVAPTDILDAAKKLRSEVYRYGTDRELLIVDVIFAVIRRKIGNSSIKCLPLYSSLTFLQWLETLNKPRFIKEFWPAQKLLGEKGVFSGTSAVVQMPTSAGKTKSIEIIIRSSFLSGRATVAVVIAPFRALCREISSTFQEVFENENVDINELQDVLSISDDDQNLIDFLTESTPYVNARKSIIVTTPEKLVYLLRHEPQLTSGIGLLIFDEGHQFDSGTRGVTYELLIAALKSSVGNHVQKVLISAVIANARSISEWLNGETGIDVQGNKCLPTIRSIAFASWQTNLGQLQYIDPDRADDREFFVPRVIEQINLGRKGRERTDRFFPRHNDNPSLAAYLGVKLCHQGPVAIFCGIKSTVTTISETLVDCYDRGLLLPAPSASSDISELEKIANLSMLHFGGDYIFSKSIRLGVLPHSSNIPNGIRVSVEWVMERNKAVLVVCTSTLAQGVNLPIKYLIVSSTFQAGKEISTRDFHNLIGRAGRSGYHTEGSIIFADSDIFDKKLDFQNKWKWQRTLHLLDFSNAEDCVSSLMDLITPLDSSSIQADVLDFIYDPKSYRQRCIQIANERQLDIGPLLSQMIQKERLMSALESYFLSYLKDRPDADELFFDELAQGTLAYFLSNDNEKQVLRQAFSHVASRVLSVPDEKRSFYGKSLLGIDQLVRIDEWLDENQFGLELSNGPEELLVECWPLISSLIDSNIFSKIKPTDVLLGFAKNWISGFSYGDLHTYLIDSNAVYQAGTQQRSIVMDHVIDIADGALSFDSMLIVGAIVDIAEGRGLEDNILNLLRVLQNRLKLGLSSNLEIWLYSRGYVDREVCKVIALSLQEIGVPLDGFDYRVLDTHRDLIFNSLLTLPTYFSRS